MTQLSNISPDLEDLIAQLTADLVTKNAWKDLVEGATGQTLIEFIAAVGTMLNFNLERALQENFTGTASIDSSIYNIAIMLGVNPRRRVSATTTADVGLADPLPGAVTIPALSQFKINSEFFYNVNDIVFTAGQVLVNDVEFEQGELQVENFTSDGTVNQEFVVGQEFTSNENLMRVLVDGTPYMRERRTFFNYSDSAQVFLERMTGEGEVLIIFGDGFYGVIPISGASIEVTHAISNGVSSNNATSGLTVSLIDTIPSLYGNITLNPATSLTVSPIVGGADKESADEIRYTAPRLYAAADRAITRDDWKAISLNFPGTDIVDVYVIGEHEKFPTNNTVMNMIDVTLLNTTGTALSAPEKSDFLDYIDAFKHVTTEVIIIDPVAIPVTVDIEVFYFDGEDPIALQNTINDQITDLYSIKLGALGKQYEITDITNLVDENSGVDYTRVTLPAAPLTLGNDEFADLTTLTITMTLSTRE